MIANNTYEHVIMHIFEYLEQHLVWESQSSKTKLLNSGNE